MSREGGYQKTVIKYQVKTVENKMETKVIVEETKEKIKTIANEHQNASTNVIFLWYQWGLWLIPPV